MIGKPARGAKCDAIIGIIDEAEEIMGEVDDPETLDAAMVASAQAVEHYEITRYGTLITWAKQLGHDDAVSLLEETLKEEKETDAKLTKVAEQQRQQEGGLSRCTGRARSRPQLRRRARLDRRPGVFLCRTMSGIEPIHIVGGGMAGCEAAWAAASLGVPVVIHEMRPHRGTEAHRTDGLAELVCSNSFRSDDDETNAVGLLHWEMRRLGSVMMAAAAEAEVPAGGALAVDRDVFSAEVTRRLLAHPLITVERGEVAGLPPAGVVERHHRHRAADLASRWPEAIRALTGEASLAFFDAIAPIVYADSVDLSKAWFQSRYDKGETEEERTAYLNCAMDRGAVRALHRRPAGGAEDRVPRLGDRWPRRPISRAACRSR